MVEIQGQLPEVEANISVESVELGNVHLTAAPTEHRFGLEDHRAELARLIHEADIVIPEYFPPEMMGNKTIKRALRKLPPSVSSNIDEINRYFDPVAEMVATEGNGRVLVADPAYDERFAAVRFAPLVIASAGLAVLHAGNSIDSDAARLTGTLATLAGTTSFGTRYYETHFHKELPFQLPSEANLRRYIIAQNLVDFAEKTTDPTSALLVYPPAHWNHIRDLIEDDKKRAAGLKRYMTFLNVVRLGNIALPREYAFKDDKWVRASHQGWGNKGML